MTQRIKAIRGEVTKEMKKVAEEEGITPENLRRAMVEGKVVIPANHNHRNLKPVGIGRGLRTKINANIGTSPMHCSIEEELKKLEVCIRYGADTVMDLSTGGDLASLRRTLLKHSPLPLGTVPIYEVMVEYGCEADVEDILNIIEEQAKDGVDFMTLHAGLTYDLLPLIKKRLLGVVSRGGGFLVQWMRRNKNENPLYSHFDDILEIAARHDVTLSLGDGLRPGALADAGDDAQLSELSKMGELTQRAWKAGVQVIVEGPGHVPLNMIKQQMEEQEKICKGAPFYVLGPLVTDITPGYDHITGAIGGALAAYYGASFLCYITPAEHLRLPTIEDVKEGIIATRIAAHAADVARGIKKVRALDDEMSKARAELNWRKMLKLAINPERAKEYKDKSEAKNKKVCTMCGKYCVLQMEED